MSRVPEGIPVALILTLKDFLERELPKITRSPTHLVEVEELGHSMNSRSRRVAFIFEIEPRVV